MSTVEDSPARFASRVPPAEIGNRVELRRLADNSENVAGMLATVIYVEKTSRRNEVATWQVGVATDSGRTMFLSWPDDVFRRIL